MKFTLKFACALLLPLATQAMEADDNGQTSENLLRQIVDKFAPLSLVCDELNTVIFPRHLNSEDIQNIITGKGIFISPSNHKLLLASTAPGTEYISHLTSTAYIETFASNICAYRVCHKGQIQCSNALENSSEDATSEEFKNAFNEAVDKKAPQNISDIKMRTGFDQPQVAPKVIIKNPMSFKASFRLYQLYFSEQTPDQDPAIGQFALVFLENKHNVDLATYQQFLKTKISELHKKLESRLSECSFLCCDLNEEDFTFQ